MPVRHVFLHLITTGEDPRFHGIAEIAAVDETGTILIEEIVNPGVAVAPEVRARLGRHQSELSVAPEIKVLEHRLAPLLASVVLVVSGAWRLRFLPMSVVSAAGRVIDVDEIAEEVFRRRLVLSEITERIGFDPRKIGRKGRSRRRWLPSVLDAFAVRFAYVALERRLLQSPARFSRLTVERHGQDRVHGKPRLRPVITRDGDPRLRRYDEARQCASDRGKPWDEEQEALLYRMWGAGSWIPDIQKELPRSAAGLFARLEIIGAITRAQNPYVFEDIEDRASRERTERQFDRSGPSAGAHRFEDGRRTGRGAG